MHILILFRSHSIHLAGAYFGVHRYINISAEDTNMDPQRHSDSWLLLYSSSHFAAEEPIPAPGIRIVQLSIKRTSVRESERLS